MLWCCIGMYLKMYGFGNKLLLKTITKTGLNYNVVAKTLDKII